MRVIVLGCGRIGAELAITLDGQGHTVSIIDWERDAFRRLPDRFTGRAVLGTGFDRGVLEQADIERADAVAAVMYGDNSNIVAARIARETYQVPNVVARIKDPRRAEIYQRLGIPTVATVTWTTDQVMRRLFPDGTVIDWTDPTGHVSLVERDLPPAWAGKHLEGLDDGDRHRLVAVSRGGAARVATTKMVGQEGDLLHIVVRKDALDALDVRLASGGGHSHQ